MGGEIQRVSPRGDLTEPSTACYRGGRQTRNTRTDDHTGRLHRAARSASTESADPPQYQPPPPQPDYRGIQQLFGEAYQVEAVRLDSGFVDQGIDVLLVGKPGALTDAEMFAVDQFLMRGGSVIALAGRNRADAGQQGLTLSDEPPALTELLATYGVTVGEGVVMDSQHATFPVRWRIGEALHCAHRTRALRYFRTSVEMASTVPASRLRPQRLTMPWASPLTLAESSTPCAFVPSHQHEQRLDR